MHNKCIWTLSQKHPKTAGRHKEKHKMVGRAQRASERSERSERSDEDKGFETGWLDVGTIFADFGWILEGLGGILKGFGRDKQRL